jgi:pseudouridine synthase
MERLQKILSQAGVASRRGSEQLMLDGRVTLNGATIRKLGTKADPSHDDIRVDGRRIRLPERHRYLLLNKPRGYVTTRSDPQQRPTVIDLLQGVRASRQARPAAGLGRPDPSTSPGSHRAASRGEPVEGRGLLSLPKGEYVYPVGRLDFDSEGLLLLTNDGDLAARLTHPSHGVPRVYEARVLGVPDGRDLERLAGGVVIDGRRTRAADVRLSRRSSWRAGGADADRAVLVITIREGRNRQVRRMCEAIGHPVDHLKRVSIGPIRDPRLKVGQWRELTEDEVRRLRAAAGLDARRPPNDHRGGRGALREKNR